MQGNWLGAIMTTTVSYDSEGSLEGWEIAERRVWLRCMYWEGGRPWRRNTGAGRLPRAPCVMWSTVGSWGGPLLCSEPETGKTYMAWLCHELTRYACESFTYHTQMPRGARRESCKRRSKGGRVQKPVPSCCPPHTKQRTADSGMMFSISRSHVFPVTLQRRIQYV